MYDDDDDYEYDYNDDYGEIEEHESHNQDGDDIYDNDEGFLWASGD